MKKNSDYHYLSNRKMMLGKIAGLLFPRKFNQRTSLFTLMHYNSNMVLWLSEHKDKAGSAKVINLGM